MDEYDDLGTYNGDTNAITKLRMKHNIDLSQLEELINHKNTKTIFL